ncbi:MAG: hypothetical protein WD152_05065 [Nitriliruptoraceae bacterium]
MQRDSRGKLLAAVFGAIALVAAACTGQADQVEEVHVSFASFDVAVGEDQRILAGLRTSEAAIIAFGEVEFALAFLGDEPTEEVPVSQMSTARFLPVPGAEPEPEGAEPHPRALTGQPGVGLYSARVDLNRPGRWALQVTADLGDGRSLQGTTIFMVLDEPLVPTVGDAAPRVANLTIADVETGNAPAYAVDSRAGSADGSIPAPLLHTTSIPEALDARQRMVIAVTTPVYCVSQFCGPLTNVMADMAETYAPDIAFVHIEVWHDFENAQLTDAAAAWIQTEIGGNEPWVFVVDADGTIVARWDNVLDVNELEQLLAAW